jgi:hypothetical protein
MCIPMKTESGFLCGTEFATLADETNFFSRETACSRRSFLGP